ncbi:MAG: PEP-CTERM sorting domain-containing protein [Verrucomicrobiota bacterium]
MSLNFPLLGFLGLVLAAGSANAGTFSLSLPLTDDASTGISTARTYTHAITGGGAATVNGVSFSLLNSSTTPANFTWTSTGGKAEVVNNNNNWVPATGGVTGPGLLSLLGSLTYAPQGPGPGASQTFTLSGLNVGTLYDTRLYIRSWDIAGSGRGIDLTAANGAESNSFSILEDRPGTVLGTGNVHQAYYINYRFTAQTTSLDIIAAVPAGAAADSGSFHIYGLTNQVVPEPGSTLGALLAAGVFAVRRRRRN